MADEKQQGSTGKPEDEFGDFLSDDVQPRPSRGADVGGAGDDSGLGNLPPLSDFESESAGSRGGRFDSGLPPLDEIREEVPRPTGGNVRPAPPGFEERSAFDTPISDSGLDTPQPTPRSGSGTSFQDLTTDSDFSPETPEIGPGPDSDLETPMFDSAFGPGGSFDRTPDTSAPTQAMETPMFGERGSGGFDADAFGSGSRGGTPIPDFSPDTGIPGRVPPPPPMATPPMSARSSGGGGGAGTAIVVGLLALLIGLGAGAFFLADKVGVFPAASRIAELESQTASQTQQIASLRQQLADTVPTGGGDGGGGVDLEAQVAALTQERDQLASEVQTGQTELASLNNRLTAAQADVARMNQEYADAQRDYDDLVNMTTIERARADGLSSEVTRLQSQVGTLEQAAQRSAQIRQQLLSDVAELEVTIQESIALTPAKYSHEERLAAVRELRAQVQQAPAVTPELMARYQDIYQREMDIARSREYFFARIPVQDRYGVTEQKWAEAVMNGNWSVYFRTIDGRSVGIYEKVPGSNPAQYTFRQFLPEATARQIEQEIINARVPGYEERINTLAQRELTMQGPTGVQRLYDSL